jgi:hypothetical protein
MRQTHGEAHAVGTPNLGWGERDALNGLTLQVGNERIQLKETTAESVLPSDEVSAVFSASRDSLIEQPVTGVALRLRNVDRLVTAAEATTGP